LEINFHTESIKLLYVLTASFLVQRGLYAQTMGRIKIPRTVCRRAKTKWLLNIVCTVANGFAPTNMLLRVSWLYTAEVINLGEVALSASSIVTAESASQAQV
jgi:hypothetical protein